MLYVFLLSPFYIFSSSLAFSHQVELKSEVMFISGELSTDTEMHGKGNFTGLQHLAYDFQSLTCMCLTLGTVKVHFRQH